jgi:hypothetical protein
MSFLISLALGWWLIWSGMENLRSTTVHFKWNFVPLSRYSRINTPFRFWFVVGGKFLCGVVLLCIALIALASSNA